MAMEQTRAEIEAIRTQIQALRRERDSLTSQAIQPEDESPEAIAEAYRRQAREEAQLSTEVKGIDNAIAALEGQLKQKQRQLQPSLSQEQLIDEETQQAYDRANRINELAAELVEELRALKAIAHDLSPAYWQLHHKPFVTGFKGISVPYLQEDGNILMIKKMRI
jgi:chromosome segregation ATPase